MRLLKKLIRKDCCKTFCHDSSQFWSVEIDWPHCSEEKASNWSGERDWTNCDLVLTWKANQSRMEEFNPCHTSFEDYEIEVSDPQLSDQTSSGIGSDVGSDTLVDPCSTGILDERTYHDSGVFSQRDSDSNLSPSTSSVRSDHTYFLNKKNSFMENLTDGWKRLSVQRLSGMSD